MEFRVCGEFSTAFTQTGQGRGEKIPHVSHFSVLLSVKKVKKTLTRGYNYAYNKY